MNAEASAGERVGVVEQDARRRRRVEIDRVASRVDPVGQLGQARPGSATLVAATWRT